MSPPLLQLHSDCPWHLRCTVDRVGRDYLIRIHGGDAHVGAVALSQWSGDQAVVECLTVERHKERDIAVHAAYQLCSVSRRSVVSVAGIHFDGITRSEIEDISRAANHLAVVAAERLDGSPPDEE